MTNTGGTNAGPGTGATATGPGTGGTATGRNAGDGAIDWPALRAAASEAKERAYCPYSNFPVGAAALVDDGRVITGCNVENASYGLGLCAECAVVSALHGPGKSKEPRLVALSVVDGHGNPLMPCGRCRQLLWEFGGAALLLETVRGILPMSEVLPDAFGPDDLIERR